MTNHRGGNSHKHVSTPKPKCTDNQRSRTHDKGETHHFFNEAVDLRASMRQKGTYQKKINQI